MIVENRLADGEMRSFSLKERCILVGFQLDGNGRRLLSWALTNIATVGDCIMAVNVCRHHQDMSRTSSLSFARSLNEFMADHRDLCTRKKILLVGRIARGNSVKRILVKEAELCAAKTVVVGSNKNFSFCGQASLAKYCAKKLPSSVSLIGVDKGQIIFERPASKLKAISVVKKKQSLRSFLHPNIGMPTKPTAHLSSNKEKKIAKQETKECKDYCSISYDKKRGSRRSSVSILTRRSPEPKPGWPLLCKTVKVNIGAFKDSEVRETSVVEWAMKLPNRNMASVKSKVDLIKELEIILALNSSVCKFFQYEQLQNSANLFSQENLIGKGGNSKVYIGCLPNAQQVAIKVSKLNEESLRDFFLEVDIITNLQHECIVQLIGICVQKNNPLSVYSYFSKGSLEENLHGKRAKTQLDWIKRFKVAVGVAKALNYMHNGCSRPVIHRDVKSSNILLSDDYKPKISDFGLAIWGPTTSPYVTHSDVVGTFGYLAPEYFMYGKVSIKIDVYAFGVVLLELITGRKPINDESPKGQESLVMWAKPVLERGDYMGLIDPYLSDNYEEDQMKRMVFAASLCINRAARNRPQMSEVLEILQGEEGIQPWMSSKVGSNLFEQDGQDDEVYPTESSIGSHRSLVGLDDDEDASVISFEQSLLNTLDDEYLRDRWSGSLIYD